MHLTRLTALGMLIAGCAPELPTPVLEAMDPAWGYNGEETETVITGEGFYPNVSAQGRKATSWDRQYAARLLGAVEADIIGVSIDDYQHLSGRVPDGLPPGVYALEVQTPSGAAINLDDAFTVTDTRADHLQVNTAGVNYTVYEPALVHISLLDPEGDPVASPLQVDVVAVGADPDTVSFYQDGLEDQEALEDAVGVRGLLAGNGEGYVTVTSAVPAELELVVSASEPGSPVTSDLTTFYFSAGEVAGVNIQIPLMTQAQAGRPFSVNLSLVDAFGNPTEGVVASLLLYETCPGGTLREAVSLIDRLEDLDVTVTGATNLDCALNSVAAAGVAAGGSVSGESSGFAVIPGDPEQLNVVATPDEVVAGVDQATVWVWAEDAWGNVAASYEGTPTLRDTVGGLDPEGGTGVASCSPFATALSLSICQAVLWTAAENVRIIAEDENGLEGTSNAITVLAGSLDSIDTHVVLPEVEAGTPFTVLLTPRDSFGNTLAIALVDAGDLSFADESEDLTCEELEPGTTTNAFSCVATVANATNLLTVELVSTDLRITSTSEPFEVINGPLAEVEIDIGTTTSVTAGETLSATLTGWDDYGNLYVDGLLRGVELTDLTGAMTASTNPVALNSAGTGTVDLSFTLATDSDQVFGAQAGRALGETHAFAVTHAALDEVTLSAPSTWTWIDEPLTLSLRASDVYGNTVLSYAAAGSLRSAGGLGDDVAVLASDWDEGVAKVDFTFDGSGLQDSLGFTVSGVDIADTDRLDVLDPACASGPTAALTVAGRSTAVLCLASGATPSTTVSGTGSTAGSASLKAWHFDLGDGEWLRQSTSSLGTSWTEERGLRVKLVVADAAACGDEAEAEVYVAESDGRAAGPVDLVLADSTLNAGLDSTAVSVRASDCAGDPAIGSLLVRADLGALDQGTLSTLSSTGEGLEISLSKGVGDLIWDMTDEVWAGEATLHVGTPSGAAYGAANATVSGDASHPIVLDLDPAGTTTDDFSAVNIQFSEPVPSRFLPVTAVSLTDASGHAATLSGITVSGDSATIALSATASSSVWTLSLSTEVRDNSGNRLDGTFREDGTSSPFSLSFGDVPELAPEVTGCTLTSAVFRPDGDDGADEEADEAEINLTATAAPSWWRLVVEDAAGDTVRVRRVSASSASAAVRWDGRDQEGFIVDNGAYSLTVAAEDDAWNRSAGCGAEVTVDNRVVEVP